MKENSPQHPRVVSVHSYKGGSGKTTLALLLAAAYAKRGEQVCLVDLDLLAPALLELLRVPKCNADIGAFLFGALSSDGKSWTEVPASDACYEALPVGRRG